MLESVKIAKRQSELRSALAELSKAESLTDETRSKIDQLDTEYQDNERRYRASLIAEDTERREAGADLETRADKEWSDLVAGFEVRQVALNLDEGRAFDGRTAEIVQELRSRGGFRGVPVPYEALETRTGETVAGNTPDPVTTRNIIDRLFAESVASRMGANIFTIPFGEVEYPVATQGATAAWQATETGNVGGPTAYQTVDRPLKPDNTLGVQMRITRRALKQTGPALEQAVRRDMAEAIRVEMDKAVFRGTGSDGQPLGVVSGAGTYGIATKAIDNLPTYTDFLTEIVEFMAANAISDPGQVRALMRPELFGTLEGTLNEVTQTTEYYRLAFLLAGRSVAGTFPNNITVSSNALAVPGGTPPATSLLFTTSTGGVPPIFVGLWGALDVIRDPYSDAQSGGLRITGLATMDVTISRTAQLRLMTGLELEGS